MSSHVLVGIEGKVQGQSWPVTAEGLRLGRQRGNEVRIDDLGVSRQHARLVPHDGALWLQDLGSRNGVFVNGARVVGQRQVEAGDRIALGTHILEIQEEASGDLPEPGPPPDGTPSPAIPLGAPLPERGARGVDPPRRRRLWPVGLALVAVVVAVLAIATSGRERIRIAEPGPADPVADLLKSTSEPDTRAAPTAGRSTVPNAGPSADTPTIPPPPAGVSAQELVEQGTRLQEAGRLHGALVAYTQARTLDPECALCTLRIGRLEAEIARAVAERLEAGRRAWDDLRHADAVQAWETVLLLDPDPGSPAHREASAYLEQARARLPVER